MEVTLAMGMSAVTTWLVTVGSVQVQVLAVLLFGLSPED